MDFRTNPLNIFAVHDVCGFADGAMATKATVHFNLFAGTVLKLGTERHWGALAREIDALNVTGCFALTELGWGNNAVEMGTTATYDPASQTWDLHTPGVLASKYWITNGAVHAAWAVVFARLLVRGRDEGVHGLLVRIRHPDGSPCAGVTIHDMGEMEEGRRERIGERENGERERKRRGRGQPRVRARMERPPSSLIFFFCLAPSSAPLVSLFHQVTRWG